MREEKVLLCQDKNNGNIIRYKCVKRDVSPFEVDYFFSTLYGMKLTSSEVNSHALKEGVTTKDLIHQLREILDSSSSVIDFQPVLDLFNVESIDSSVFQRPISNFLNMFEVNKDGEYPQSEWKAMIENELASSTNNPFALQRCKREIKSILPNTRVLQNTRLKNLEKRK